MTTLNIHAQESKSRFSCLSAADPEIIPDVRKEEIKYQYITKARKSNKPLSLALRPGEVVGVGGEAAAILGNI